MENQSNSFKSVSYIFYRFSYYELAKDIKHNKGGILRASVIYVRILKSDLLKKQRLEEICNSQHDRLSQMINKIRVGSTYPRPLSGKHIFNAIFFVDFDLQS